MHEKKKKVTKKTDHSKKIASLSRDDAVKGLSEADLRAELSKAAKTVTLETLPAFISQALDRPHDYGTICVAIGAIAAGAAHAVDRSPKGGITGFQASAVFWEFQRQWGVFGSGDEPLRMLQYNNMLYPQYNRHFTSISVDTWAWLQKRAAELLAEPKYGVNPAIEVVNHWKSIAGGIVPFGFDVANV